MKLYDLLKFIFMFLVLQFLNCKFMKSINDVSIHKFCYALNVPYQQLCFGSVIIL
jgi:hypothetical protein